jgi:hypothetical protein
VKIIQKRIPQPSKSKPQEGKCPFRRSDIEFSIAEKSESGHYLGLSYSNKENTKIVERTAKLSALEFFVFRH